MASEGASRAIVAVMLAALTIFLAFYVRRKVSADGFTASLMQKNPEIFRRLADI